MTLYHALSDPPRTCWACVDDAVNAPDEPMPEHDPEVAGTDEDGPYCVCGHHLTEARTDTVVLTITHDQAEPPGPKMGESIAAMLARALEAAGITAHITAQLQPEP